MYELIYNIIAYRDGDEREIVALAQNHGWVEHTLILHRQVQSGHTCVQQLDINSPGVSVKFG